MNNNNFGMGLTHEVLESVFLPIFFRISNSEDNKAFSDLIDKKIVANIHDDIYNQLKELIKCENPSNKLTDSEYSEHINMHLGNRDIKEYGVWVYYPWNSTLVHLLDEPEFVKVRTNRNQYKITLEEQNILKTKKIGIIGLSVGQSIALTIAMERTCGELRLADFDTVELSNLNRIRTSLNNLGLKKTVIAAREIAEIDPFIKLKLFNEGLHEDNMNEFFMEGGKLDLLVEVCDGLDIKIESRFKARELQIPVVMETNDRGMLDVERFDLEVNRPILHGLAGGLDPRNIKGLSNEEKIPYILRMIGAETLSTRLKASMIEVEQSINTWPQLASSVTLGGALTTDVSRRILLDQFHDSGRYYIDLEGLVKNKENIVEENIHSLNPYHPLKDQSIQKITNLYFKQDNKGYSEISEEQLNKIIDAAIVAPSAGNNQPWKWVFKNGVLFLFHDKYRSWSWGDYYEMGSHMSLGAALENVHLQAAALNLKDNIELFPIENERTLIAAIHFMKLEVIDDKEVDLSKHLYDRHTNRKLSIKQKLPIGFFDKLKLVIPNNEGVEIFHTQDETELAELAEIIAECDKLRLLNEMGHQEFFHEIRWTSKEAEVKGDGIELSSVDVSKSEIAGFKVAQDWKAVELLANWNKGNAFKKLSIKSVTSASAMLVFSIAEFNHTQLINVGRLVQKIWIFANQENVSVHPMLSPAFFFNKMIHDKDAGFKKDDRENLKQMRERFLRIFPLDKDVAKGYSEVFLMKLSIADEMETRSLRRPKDDSFVIMKD